MEFNSNCAVIEDDIAKRKTDLEKAEKELVVMRGVFQKKIGALKAREAGIKERESQINEACKKLGIK